MIRTETPGGSSRSDQIPRKAPRARSSSMASEFSQDAVLRFLRGRGGKVRNAELLGHFTRFLREDAEKERNREAFKRFVNAVATVVSEEGASTVVLRRKYRGDATGSGEREPRRGGKPREWRAAETLPAVGIIITSQRSEVSDPVSPLQHANCPLKPCSGSGRGFDESTQSREADAGELLPGHCDVTPPSPERKGACPSLHMSSSTPCLLERPDPPHPPPQIGLSRSNDSLLTPAGFPMEEYEAEPHSGRHRAPSSRHSLTIPSPSSLPDESRFPLHHSTGHLDDSASTRSSSPEVGVGGVARRGRSRLCRSLGEDLDQPFPGAAARLHRLHFLSSTLSMGNLVDGGADTPSRPQDTPLSRHSSVPLEPREHEWFLKAASAAWSDIYALFRSDSTLLNRRDFLSGFSVVHWIAKHGDHRVLNTLWYGVEKAGLRLEVDARSLSGYTPLHLAALHGHRKLMRMLVLKHNANVKIRDHAGKRAWQHLRKDESRDIFELLGAPAGISRTRPALTPPTRPASARPEVKRHSSLAALFKHRTQLRLLTGADAF